MWGGRLTVETLKPEEKVNLSISMSATCIRVCVDALRDQDATITEEEVLEKVRARIMYAKRRHHEV
jgi:hypothetical protein